MRASAVALLLAGGYGKRLRPLTDHRPKPMLLVSGKPVLEWQVEVLKRQGVRKFVLLVGYKAEVVEEHFGDGSRLGVEITYSREPEPLGTGGALKKASEVVEAEDFIVMNGDVLTNLDARKLLEKLRSDRSLEAVLAAVELRSPFGVLEIDENDLVRCFIEKPVLSGIWINAGVYAMRKSALEKCPERGDLEKSLFPRLASEGKLAAVKYSGVLWKSIDSHKDLEEAEEIAPKLLEPLGQSF